MTDELADITVLPGETTFTLVGKGGEKVLLTRGADDLFRDPQGTIIGLVNRELETDTDTRAGFGPFHFPEHWVIAKVADHIAIFHDYKYSSKAYQQFHNRSEADADLKRDVYLFSKDEFPTIESLLLSDALHEIVRDFGSKFWDNSATDDTEKIDDGIDDV